jgi:hypothetical protein
MSNAIQDELHEALEFKTKVGEKRQVYLKRLMEGVDELEDADFNQLSQPTQDWAEAAAQAIVNKKAIPDFPKEDEGEEGEEGEEGGTNGATPKKPVKKAAGKAGAKKAAPAKKPASKKEKADPATRAARPRGSLPTGSNKNIQDILATDPNASIERIIEILEKQGKHVPSRVNISTSRSAFRSALETMHRKGLLKASVDLSGRG